MRNLNENNITDAVIARFQGCDDPRLKTVLTSLVKHLHAFVRDVEPTEQEWAFGIDFLTRTGHMCDDKRQEFILLSDTLGVTMLVDAINNRRPPGATPRLIMVRSRARSASDRTTMCRLRTSASCGGGLPWTAGA